MEAMDVLQEQVAGYENEIRMLNTMKSPKRPGSGKPENRRKIVEAKSLGLIGKRQPSAANLGNDPSSLAAVGVLEAALFRPALSGALRDAAKWKNAALSKALQELPPLSIPGASSQEESIVDALDNLSRLSAAMAAFRMEQASIKVVNLEESGGKSRSQLRAAAAGKAIAEENLESAAASVRRYLAEQSAGSCADQESRTLLVGKLTLQGKEPFQTFSAAVSKDELLRMNMHVVR